MAGRSPKPFTTSRQSEILRMRCIAGLSVKQVAEALFLSEQTVKNHITGIFRRAGHSSMCQLCYELGVRVGEGRRDGGA